MYMCVNAVNRHISIYLGIYVHFYRIRKDDDYRKPRSRGQYSMSSASHMVITDVDNSDGRWRDVHFHITLALVKVIIIIRILLIL